MRSFQSYFFLVKYSITSDRSFFQNMTSCSSNHSGVHVIRLIIVVLYVSSVFGADECIGNSQCLLAGQQCIDPNYNVMGDWSCNCVGSGTGSQVGGAATCTWTGECQASNAICSGVNQQGCEDPDPMTAGDVRCICVPPYTTVSLTPGGVTAAVCTLNECNYKSVYETCANAGQLCQDPSTSVTSTNDWTCSCVAPSTGTGQQVAATCVEVGECQANSMTCTAAGQTCDDPSTTTVNDWQCKCVAPATGLAQTVGVASCILNECTATCPSCANSGNGNSCAAMGQTCEDPNTSSSSLSDWSCVVDECNTIPCGAAQNCNDRNKAPTSLGDYECSCKAPQTGTQAGGLATCLLDECNEPSKGGVCSGAGQSCSDSAGLNNWECACLPPSFSMTSGKQAAATCTWSGGCGGGNSDTCTNVGQSCFSVGMAFQCLCVAPEQGTAMAGAPATCTLDECTAVCPTCADQTGSGNSCTLASQTCTDPDKSAGVKSDWFCVLDECTTQGAVCSTASPVQTCTDPNPNANSLGDWSCSCTVGMGSQVGGVASCVVDECVANSATCTAGGQTCNEPNPSVSGDWECVCMAPAVGTQVGGIATCANDECAVAMNSVTCTTAGQRCNDPNPANAGDWQCECVAPATGTATAGMAATCTQVGECIANAATCTAASQSCNDPDPMVDMNWQCICIVPATGTPTTMGVATCQTDECSIAANSMICTQAGQLCEDTDKTTIDTWECVCNAPFINRATRLVATCSLDECLANAATCTAAGQECGDPDLTVAGDWQCKCIAPATGAPVTMMAAVCMQTGECATMANEVICTNAGQACEDPDPMATGDWVCKCIAPEMGANGMNAAATCTVDECTISSVLAICTNAGQTCEDNDASVRGDWECVCAMPSTTRATALAATCRYDECTDMAKAMVCTAGTQTCNDPDQSVADNWQCECVLPKSGTSTTMALASCTLDECVTQGSTCANAGQNCNDPDQTVADDWQCECIMPATGMSTTMMPATCTQVGECIANGPTCTAAGQNCVDPNMMMTVGDWQCECIAPQTGASVTMGVATCTLDECTVMINSQTCTTAGQVCDDADKNTLDSWECVCNAPFTNRATKQAATCSLDECVANIGTCTAAGQNCNDLDLTVAGDWQCECVAPATGAPVTMMAAVCMQTGECATMANEVICTNTGQACEDPDPMATGDWVCKCIAPEMGSNGLGAPSSCSVDECTISTNSDVCTMAGQACEDTNTAIRGDWECVCSMPSTTRATARVVTTCLVDECTDMAKAVICTAVSQACNDPDPSVADNWQCECVLPQMGTPNPMAAATCSVDECVTQGSTCANAGQNCNDPDQTVADDWQCECIMPATGMSTTMMPAMCTQVGECIANGPTCTAAGQNCVDPNMMMTVGDWQCECIAPQTGASVTMGVATCTLDECAVMANSQVCTASGQVCDDADKNTLDSWECVCNAPFTNRATRLVATCSLDECLANVATCTAAGQNCNDPDLTVVGDWQCECVAPATGAPVTMMAAVCMQTGECATMANEVICTNAGQACEDPDPMATGDWVCKCIAPEMGANGMNAAATCTVDECTISSVLAICTNAGQTCEDNDASVRGDWECVCAMPSTTRATALAATCRYDECTDMAKAMVCTAGTQTCNDPDQSVADNWQCECVLPKSGTSTTMALASCTLDECVTQGSTCANAGQNCNDPDQTVADDWQCECIMPATGMSTTMMPAMCTQVGECIANGPTCTAAGQNCIDPDQMLQGDWVCECIAPETGANGTNAPALCTLNECDIVLNNQTCATANQTCEDNNFAIQDDWECVCQTPHVGRATKQAATCTFDECTVNDRTCNAAGQRCVEPDPLTQGDWQCECLAPATGTPQVGGAATCAQVGECIGNSGTCTALNQVCYDPDPGLTNDWMCSCIPPWNGTNVTMGGALCEYDECLSNGDTCTNAGQTCEDADETSRDDWYCVCPLPATERKRAAIASCTIDECDVVMYSTNVFSCLNAGQRCMDPDPLVRNNWECQCVTPATGMPGIMTPTTCNEAGDCALNAQTCTAAGQSCNIASGNWQCECISPESGSPGVSQPAICDFDECTVNATASTCTAAGQTCQDMNKAKRNTWECVCPSPYTTTGLLSVAVCSLDECIANASVCTSAGQTCDDPDPLVLGDWVCKCVAPAVGPDSVASAATCTQKGECQMFFQTCAAQNQSCDDPNDTNPGDWQCVCIAPRVGNQTAAVASCMIDECTIQNIADVCTAAGQTCNDTDVNSEGNWECLCPPPITEKAMAQAATCTIDECSVYGDNCTTNSQNCNDPDQSILGDWTCDCRAPSTGSQARGPATCQQVGECQDQLNLQICEDGNQTCNDPDTTTNNTWQCECVFGTGTPAVMQLTQCSFDECTDAANSAVCTAANQTCLDNDLLSTNNWKCVCAPPLVGTAVMTPAQCPDDECQQNLATCQSQGQECVDPDTSKVGDWECRCLGSVTTVMTGIAQPAICTYLGDCATNSATCLAAGQTCFDNDPMVMGDWECRCISPEMGNGMQDIANCTIDECAVNGNNNTCLIAGQTCIDLDKTADDNWECVCIPEAGGRATMQAATCSIDECLTKANIAICSAGGQECIDLAASTGGDWTCNCFGTQMGTPAVGRLAACNSTGDCTVTANEATCNAAGQSCEDMMPGWGCSCVPPYTGSTGSMGLGDCTLDECLLNDNKKKCEDVGQTCNDPDNTISDDWTCTCPTPENGTAIARAALCSLDECSLTNNTDVCRQVGQTCLDSDFNVRGDWTCNCVAPATGSSVAMTATCNHVGECIANANVCESVQQSCNDPDLTSDMDWRCMCVPPLLGTYGIMAPGSCDYDECKILNVSSVCNKAAQECVDPNPSITSQNDWECRCVAPSTGSDVARPADCQQIGICVNSSDVCTLKSQTCNDIGGGYFECLCLPPSVGSALEMAAECDNNECNIPANRDICMAVGQECRDDNPSFTSRDDWYCKCVGAGTGTNVRAVAQCSWSGACDNSSSICTNAMQTCNNTDSNDWQCECITPFNGTSLGKPAQCDYNECNIKDLCASQRCFDPNPTEQSVGDWECHCVLPSTGDKAVAKTATCVVKNDCPFLNKNSCTEKVTHCDWEETTGKCTYKYCTTRSFSCVDKICRPDSGTSGATCVRTDCGKLENPASCGEDPTCEWIDDPDDQLAVSGNQTKPYELAPAYCKLKQEADDNSSLLLWVIIIAMVLCICVIFLMVLARKLRKKLDTKKEHRKNEVAVQERLLSADEELADLQKLCGNAGILKEQLEVEPPIAPTLKEARAGVKSNDAEGDVEDNLPEREIVDDDHDPVHETERAKYLKESLAHMKLGLAKQLIQEQQREDARGLERSKRNLERQMDDEKNKKEKQKQLERAKKSHALQLGVAEREAARRMRERKREQELLLEIEKTQGQTIQQRVRQLDLAERHDELRELADDGTGRQAFVSGETYDDAQKSTRRTNGMDALLHGDAHETRSNFGTRSFSSASPLSPEYAHNAPETFKKDTTPQKVYVNNSERGSKVTPEVRDDHHTLDDSKSQYTDFESRRGDRTKPGDVQQYYQQMVKGMVTDKLAATEARTKMEDPTGNTSPVMGSSLGHSSDGAPDVRVRV